MMRRLSAMICRHVEAWRNREITSGLPVYKSRIYLRKLQSDLTFA